MSDKIVEHHIKYVETHGYDETEFITDTEHQRINHKELFPMLDSKERARISRDAHKRTRKYKDRIVAEIRQRFFINIKGELSREAIQKKAII